MFHNWQKTTREGGCWANGAHLTDLKSYSTEFSSLKYYNLKNLANLFQLFLLTSVFINPLPLGCSRNTNL